MAFSMVFILGGVAAVGIIAVITIAVVKNYFN